MLLLIFERSAFGEYKMLKLSKIRPPQSTAITVTASQGNYEEIKRETNQRILLEISRSGAYVLEIHDPDGTRPTS